MRIDASLCDASETRSLTCKNIGAQRQGCNIERNQQSKVKLLGVTSPSSYPTVRRYYRTCYVTPRELIQIKQYVMCWSANVPKFIE